MGREALLEIHLREASVCLSTSDLSSKEQRSHEAVRQNNAISAAELPKSTKRLRFLIVKSWLLPFVFFNGREVTLLVEMWLFASFGY